MNNISFDYDVKESLSFDKNDKVIIMFHGYGSNKDDLFSFAKFMNPNFLIISIQAPIQMDYNSYCWWPINLNNDMQLQMDEKEAKNSLNELNRFISEDLSIKYNFGHTKHFSSVYASRYLREAWHVIWSWHTGGGCAMTG